MNLKTWNWLAAAVHGASAVGLGVYFLVKKGTVNFNTDLYTYDVDLDADDPDNSVVTAKKAVSISDVLLKILVIVYLLQISDRLNWVQSPAAQFLFVQFPAAKID